MTVTEQAGWAELKHRGSWADLRKERAKICAGGGPAGRLVALARRS
jgi:hypothetical protein